VTPGQFATIAGIFAGSVLVFLVGQWWRHWRRQRDCFHHDRRTGTTWIQGDLIDLGMRKLFTCQCCHQRWVV